MFSKSLKGDHSEAFVPKLFLSRWLYLPCTPTSASVSACTPSSVIASVRVRMKGTDATRAAIEQAEGYLALGMGLDALYALDRLPEELKPDQRVLELYLECLCHEKEWEKASMLGEAVTTVLAQCPLALFWLAVARCRCGDVCGARRALGRAIELDPRYRERVIREPLLEAIW